MSRIWQDLTLAARFLRKSPGFTVPAVLTLALGIGANATVFSLADAVLLRRLPVPDADRIVHGYQRRTTQGPYPLSYAEYLDYRAAVRSFDALAAHYPTAPLHVLFNGEPAALSGAVVTASYFDVLQLRPAAGRFFTAEEDRVRDRDAVAVMSDALWARQFARDPSVLGSTISVNGRVFTIVGIAPPGFTGVHPRRIQTDLWIPSAMFGVGYRFCNAFERSCRIVDMIGRLRPGVALKDAQTEIDVVARQLEQSYPATNKGMGATLVPARGLGLGPRGEETRQIALFLAVVTLVLMIACANIAGLMFARGTGRRKEIAIRLALGAGRRRLVRQLLTESLLLAVMGGFVGLLFGFWGNAALEALYSRDGAGYLVDFHLSFSGSVIALTTGITMLAALLFGLFPAVHASRADVMTVLKDEGASGGARRARIRQVLVTGQLALSVMLLIGAGLVIQSVRHLYAGPGFDPSHVSMLRLRPSLVGYSFQRAHAYQRQVVEHLESLPGVVSASPSSFLALIGAGVRVTVTTRPDDAASSNPVDVVGGHVGPRYFSTIGLRLIEGREFSDQDSRTTSKVAVINDVLARKLWPGGRAEGRIVLLNGTPYTVVGVVPDAQYYAAGEPPRGQVFYDYWQVGDDDAFLKDARMHVRVAGNPRAMTAALRRETAAIDPAVPIVEDYPLSDRVAYAYQPVRVARTVLASFAALALVLSAVGLYGVLAVTVGQRTREIGLRMALGARRGQVGALVARDALQMTICGTLLGIAAAWMGGRLLGSLLYGVGGTDAAAFLLAPALLVVVAAFASFIPVRRATSVSPTIALRYE